MSLFSFLDGTHTVTKPGFNRWLISPTALSIHLSIGQAYAISVFNIPMLRIMGITESVTRDWQITTISWIFSIAIVFPGLSATVFGKWVEQDGPRKAMFRSVLCFSDRFLIPAPGVYLYQIWSVYLGYSALVGIGLGIGYMSPVSALIKRFPDRPGMATDMAIMCFGGGAMLGSARATNEENYFTQKFTRIVLGTYNVNCCARVCYVPSAVGLKIMLGTGAATNSFDDIERARTILVSGSNTTENHPIVGTRIRWAKLHGINLNVIDPRKIELTRYADIHLQLHPGTNIPLFNSLACVIIDEKLYDKKFIDERLLGSDSFFNFIMEYSPERVSKKPSGQIRETGRNVY